MKNFELQNPSVSSQVFHIIVDSFDRKAELTIEELIIEFIVIYNTIPNSVFHAIVIRRTKECNFGGNQFWR